MKWSFKLGRFLGIDVFVHFTFLSVLIEAPHSDLDAVIAKHESVHQLVENGWLHLFAIEDKRRVIVRRISGESWQAA
jgi:uncharacterized protein YbcC (UPF0753/DUF2309 family)